VFVCFHVFSVAGLGLFSGVGVVAAWVDPNTRSHQLPNAI